MTDPCLDELAQYQFPNVDRSQLLVDPYKVCTDLYIQQSKGLEFFRGYSQPSIIQRAQIYRALQFSKKCESEILDEDQKPYIVFTTSDGLVIKKHPQCKLKEYDFYLKQSDQLVFIPPKYDHINHYDLSYYRRLLSNFLQNERIPGNILVTVEQDAHFLFIALTSPQRDELDRKWIEYIQGGVIRPYTFPPNYLLAVLQNFPWTVREKFQINSLDESSRKETITIWVRSPSRDDFDLQQNKIQNQMTESSLDMKDWYPLDLPYLIDNELSIMGIIRLLSDDWDVLPLIGTSRIYLRNKSELSCTGNLISERIQEFSLPSDQEGFEIYTLREYQEMTELEKVGLIKTPQSQWYSIIGLYQACHQNPTFKDPLTQIQFSEEFISELSQHYQKMNQIFRTGFPVTLFEPQLITTQSSDDSFPTISFYLQTDSSKIFFWEIPDFRSGEYEKITTDAIQLIVSKFTDRSLFQGITSYHDPYLIFHPRALFVFEDKFDENDRARCVQKLYQHLQILSQM